MFFYERLLYVHFRSVCLLGSDFNVALLCNTHQLFLPGLSHNSFQNLVDSSASGITCSYLISFNSPYKTFLLFLKVLLWRHCFTLDLQCFNFNVLAGICCLSSSVDMLKLLAFILHFFFSSHFNLAFLFF